MKLQVAVYACCALLAVGDCLLAAHWIVDNQNADASRLESAKKFRHEQEKAAWQTAVIRMDVDLKSLVGVARLISRAQKSSRYAVDLKVFSQGDVLWTDPRNVVVSGFVRISTLGDKEWFRWTQKLRLSDSDEWAKAGDPKIDVVPKQNDSEWLVKRIASE